MKQLSDTWFAEGYIDFELKKYTLLAYLQEINKYFNENKLYPQLGDVVFHYNNLVAFRENKKFLQEHFPKKLTGLQMERLQLLYQQMIEDTELMQELEEIINYAAVTIKETLQTGVSIYEFVEDKINICPVGIIPLDIKEGYFFLSSGNTKSTGCIITGFLYLKNMMKNTAASRPPMLDMWQRGIAVTYEQIKSDLIRYHKALPNPGSIFH